LSDGSRSGGFTGELQDGQTGLVYLRARWYDPAQGRFLQRDSFTGGPTRPQSLNRYAYTENNPANWTDPSGRCVGWVWRDPTCQFIGRDRVLRGDLEWGNALDPLQVGLDVVGLVPGFGEPADGLNGGISLLRGDRVGAALSFGSMVPFAGWGATVAKWGRRGMRLGDAGRGVRQAPAAAHGLGAVPGGQMPGHAAVPPILAPRRTIDGDAYCSFSGDTDVATAAGDIPISEIEPGDTVLAYDEATGTTDVFTVTATWAHVDPMVTTVTLDGEAIATTSEHPFYVLLKGWVPAGQLQAGDSVRRADGSYGVVADVAHTYEPQVMYNLTVDTAHTFFVGDGAWLVHNTCPNPSNFWSLSWKARGTEMERMFGQNTGINFKAFDYWDPQKQRAISYKSMNLNDRSYYTNVSNINRNLSHDLKDITSFVSDTLSDGTILRSSDIKIREMWIAIPPGSGNTYNRQISALVRFQNKAQKQGVSAFILTIR
jgi:RHS repeat-associated protein